MKQFGRMFRVKWYINSCGGNDESYNQVLFLSCQASTAVVAMPIQFFFKKKNGTLQTSSAMRGVVYIGWLLEFRNL